MLKFPKYLLQDINQNNKRKIKALSNSLEQSPN